MRFPERWDLIDYLAAGTPRQRSAHAALAEAGVMERLAPWRPVLAGTIPLGIDVEGSDLDILCEVWEFEPFLERAREAFGHRPGFAVRRKESGGLPVAVVRFEAGDFLVELFAQPRPVFEQNGYRHMVVEARLLRLAGRAVAAEIRRLKAGGLKTEPAFARCFGLPGDPYQALLALYEADEAVLQQIVAGRPR
ncbi:MAG: DUF4269 domain-containing protein [Bacillota bacterium]